MYKSILRYPGGKSRAANKITDFIPYMPQEICSPFFGGGSVEMLLASRGFKIYGYDNFHSLVVFWNYVKNNSEALADLVIKHLPMTKMEFYSMQNKLIECEVNKSFNIEVAECFFILNRSSFSGSTLSGGISPGTPRFNLQSIQRLKNFGKNMKNIVSIEHKSFEESIALNQDKFLYLDPPYYLEKEKSNLYGIKGNLHRFFNHDKLCEILKSRNRWVLCYNDHPLIREMYKDYRITPIKWSYGMSKNKNSNEIILQSNEI